MISDAAVEAAASVIAASPLIDTPKLPAECWYGLARAALEAALPHLTEGWQSMESAPKDGTRVLTWNSDPGDLQQADILHWDGTKWVEDNGAWFVVSPSHWRALPTAPDRTSGGEK